MSHAAKMDHLTHPFLPAPPRTPSHEAKRASSHYLEMRDGTRIAVDVTLPRGAAPGSLPTIVRQTRYHRRMNFRGPMRYPALRGLLDQQMKSRDYFVSRGYAWVDVCARGSGASSGFRTSPWSPNEVADGGEVVDWIVSQPWSNGRVGSRGISYDGTTAEFLLFNQHPAVRAVAPRFALYDIYADVAMPGGIKLEWFLEHWAQFNAALDRNRFDEVLRMILKLGRQGQLQLARSEQGGRRDALIAAALRLDRPAAALMGRAVAGVAPVDDDDGTAIAAHMSERTQNLNVALAAGQITYRDDPGESPFNDGLVIDEFSPHSHLDKLRNHAAVYHYSGWFDGAYQRSAIQRFHAYGADHDQLILGPWEHSGKQNISPWESSRSSLFDHDAELLDFFDRHLLDETPTHEASSRVRYFTMGAERWQSAPTWPPPGVESMRWYPGENGTLGQTRGEGGEDRLLVVGRHGTGHASRWRSLLPILSITHYEARDGDDIVSYTSPPLNDAMEVTGHPIVSVALASTTSDPRLFAYLEDVAPDGTTRYVTEGMLRALHRREKREAPVEYKDIPYRTFRREDARPSEPGEKMVVKFDLYPTSYQFKKGHSIRLVLAGQDVDHFETGPNGSHMIERGSKTWLDLPVAP